MRSSPAHMEKEVMHDIARSITPISSSQTAQPTHATGIRDRGTSSAMVSSTKSITVSKIKCVRGQRLGFTHTMWSRRHGGAESSPKTAKPQICSSFLSRSMALGAMQFS